ncbi:MAG TPA: hypothetical protein VIO87_05445 [Methylotenera sp.]
MPLQAIAASNMAVCNSMMQATKVIEYSSVDMPCHQHMEKLTDVAPGEHKSKYKNVSKSHCAAMCTSLAVATIPPDEIAAIGHLVSSSSISMPYQSYASITQPNLLRPPIFLS